MEYDFNTTQKEVRAQVIKKHLNAFGTNKCVCFTCGNAAKYLREIGVDVVAVGDKETLHPGKWFTYTEIQHDFNGLFDATSGHLPIPLMVEIAAKLAEIYDGKLNEYDKIYEVYTGSGETIICLKMAFPDVKFRPVRLLNHPPTEFSIHAPLNNLLVALFDTKGV